MPRRTSPARLAELKLYLDFVRAARAFLEKLHSGRWSDVLPDGTSHFAHVAAWADKMLSEGVVPTGTLTGFKQAASDMLEMTRDLRPDAVRAADEFLANAGALSLTEMRRRIWRVVPKVLARGRIRNIDEFYIVKNALDDDSDLSRAERSRLAELVFEFEFGPPAAKKSSPARRPGRARTPRRGP